MWLEPSEYHGVAEREAPCFVPHQVTADREAAGLLSASVIRPCTAYICNNAGQRDLRWYILGRCFIVAAQRFDSTFMDRTPLPTGEQTVVPRLWPYRLFYLASSALFHASRLFVGCLLILYISSTAIHRSSHDGEARSRAICGAVSL